MNNDQVEGTVRNVAGKIEDAAGVLAGDTEHQLKGKARQVSVRRRRRPVTCSTARAN